MRKGYLAVVIAAAGAGWPGAHAAIALDFETISPTHSFLFTPVLQHYNGGAAGNGVAGPNYGVEFLGSANALCLNTLTVLCSGASAGPGQSMNHFAMSVNRGQSSGIAYMNVTPGFISLAFAYSMPFNSASDGGYVEVFSEPNGAGVSLGKLDLSQTPSGTTACPGYGANYCPFVSMAVPFTGWARSAVFQAPVPILGSGVTFDNITLTVPEPASHALWLSGLGCLAATARRKAQRRAASAEYHTAGVANGGVR